MKVVAAHPPGLQRQVFVYPCGSVGITHNESTPVGSILELPNFKNLRKERALMSIKYVALDVRQASTAASVRDQSGRVVRRGILETTPADLIGFVSSIRRPVHLAFEEGTLAQWLHD